jgi:hypothetical protein
MEEGEKPIKRYNKPKTQKTRGGEGEEKDIGSASKQLLRIKVKKGECLAYHVLSLSPFNRYFANLGCAKTE